MYLAGFGGSLRRKMLRDVESLKRQRVEAEQPRIARLRRTATTVRQRMSRIGTVVAAVVPPPKTGEGGSAALERMQAARPFDFAQGRLCHYRDYLGTNEATIFRSADHQAEKTS